MTQKEFQKRFGGKVVKGWLAFGGDLSCSGNQLTSLPENLKVSGDLYCSGNQLTSLPENLKVSGDLSCSDNQLTSLPENLKVSGDLYCYSNQLTALPENLKVGGNLYCSGNQLTSLPENLKVGGDLSCYSNQLTALPENLKVGGGLYCYSNQLTALPENLKVGGNLSCSDNQLTSLPENLKVGGNLSCSGNKIINIPEALDVKVIALFNDVFFPLDLCKRILRHEINAKEILQIENQEQRMTALWLYSPEKLIEELEAKKISNNDRGDELYEIKGLVAESVKLAKYKDWSTDRVYVDFVLPEHTNIDEALAWKHQYSIGSWLNEVQHA